MNGTKFYNVRFVDENRIGHWTLYTYGVERFEEKFNHSLNRDVVRAKKIDFNQCKKDCIQFLLMSASFFLSLFSFSFFFFLSSSSSSLGSTSWWIFFIKSFFFNWDEIFVCLLGYFFINEEEKCKSCHYISFSKIIELQEEQNFFLLKE